MGMLLVLAGKMAHILSAMYQLSRSVVETRQQLLVSSTRLLRTVIWSLKEDFGMSIFL